MTFLHDTFTGTDGTLIRSRSPDVGPDWVHWSSSGSNANTGVILGNRAGNSGGATAASNTHLIATSDAPSADYSISAPVHIISLTRQTGLMLRCQSGAYTGYLAFIDAVSSALTLYRINTGSLTSLGTWGFSWSAGQTHDVEFSVSGSGATVSLSVVVDGVERIAVDDTSANRITSAGRPGIWLGGGTQFRLDEVVAAELSGEPDPSISLSAPTNLRVFQRVSGAASVPVSGSFAGTPTAIQARVVLDGTATEVVGWTTVDASPSGGAFSGSISVPEGGWYNVEVRQSPSTEVIDSSANKFGVGAIFCIAGQSNAMQWFSIGSGTAGAGTSKFNGAWSANTGAGAIAFANAMADALDVPVAVVDAAANGAALTADGNRGSGYWLNTVGTPWTTWVSRTNAIGAKLEGVCWLQGESDALEGVSSSVYAAGLETLFDAMRTHLGQSALPIFIAPLPRCGHADGTDAEWNAINDSIIGYSGANTVVACDTWDVSMADTLHYDAAGYVVVASRFALAVRSANGESVHSRGPEVVAAVAAGVAVDVVLAHAGGSDIAPATAATGLRFVDNTGAVVPLAVNRLDDTTFRATFAAALAPPVSVAVAWGMQPSVTDPARDSVGLPVRKTMSAGIVAGVTHELDATGAASATGAATLAASLALEGVGVALSTGAAVLSADAAQSAAGGATATGTAAASIDIAFSALGLAVSGGTATLDSAASGSLAASDGASASGTATPVANVTISAAGLVQAAGAAGMSVAQLLAGARDAQAAGNAALAAEIRAIAAGAAQATGNATLSGAADGELGAAGGAVATGAAGMVATVRFAAAGGASATGAAELEGGSAGELDASGGASAAGSALASIDVHITAADFAQAMGAGYLVVQVPLSAAGGASSGGAAMLVDGNALVLIPTLRWTVEAVNRRYEVWA